MIDLAGAWLLRIVIVALAAPLPVVTRFDQHSAHMQYRLGYRVRAIVIHMLESDGDA